MSPFRHATTARKPRVAVVLALVWAGILGLWPAVGVAPWLAALMLAVTLPASWDFATGRQAGLELDAARLRWWSGRQAGEVSLARIDHVRFETRLDLSVRLRLVLDSGKRLALPQDSLPDPARLQAAFEARGLRSERHHFGLL